MSSTYKPDLPRLKPDRPNDQITPKQLQDFVVLLRPDSLTNPDSQEYHTLCALYLLLKHYIDNLPSGSGDVVGQAPVVSNTLPEYKDSTGKLIGSTGLLTADVSSAVAAKHTRQHAITSTSDHTSSATAGKLLKADASGLPVDASNTDAEVASAVSLKHPESHAVTAHAAATGSDKGKMVVSNSSTGAIEFAAIPTGGGDVTGPAGAIADNVASYNGATGKIIKDSGKALPSGAVVGDTDSQTLTNKTLTTPVIEQINDPHGNELLALAHVGSDVNYLKMTTAATGNKPTLEVVGDDTNIGLYIKSKGTGDIIIQNGAGLSITIDNTGKVTIAGASIYLASGAGIYVDNIKVLTNQQSHIVDASTVAAGSTASDGTARSGLNALVNKFNGLLAKLETIGILASS